MKGSDNNKKFDKYRSWVFDCDGVLLNSNSIKTDAFRIVTLSYGKDVADQLVQYHIKNGGISRYQKFEYFLTTIVKKKLDQDELESLLIAFSKEVNKGVMQCEIASGLNALCNALTKFSRLVVSGGDQSELRQIFSKRDISTLFNGGIFGSPDNKEDILHREIAKGNIMTPAVYIGDSKYDYIAAKNAGLDFIFLSEWSEFKGWQQFFKDDVIILRNIQELLSSVVNK